MPGTYQPDAELGVLPRPPNALVEPAHSAECSARHRRVAGVEVAPGDGGVGNCPQPAKVVVNALFFEEPHEGRETLGPCQAHLSDEHGVVAMTFRALDVPSKQVGG